MNDPIQPGLVVQNHDGRRIMRWRKGARSMDRIDTADVVRIEAMRETWVVSHVSAGLVFCCGWPLTAVRAEECRLTRKATPEERISLLRTLSKLSDASDPRCLYARRVLAEMEREVKRIPNQAGDGAYSGKDPGSLSRTTSIDHSQIVDGKPVED